MKVLVDEKCNEIEKSFKIEVGKFIKNIVMNSSDANMNFLRELELQMS